ncbi:IS4 family transposase [Deltaproteobacteria bacterium TL4]
MKDDNILEKIKQSLKAIIPTQDSRTKIGPFDFIVNLIFCYLGDSKTSSLESIRKQMKSNLNQDISKSAFWERLSRKRLKNLLRNVVSTLIVQLATTALFGIDLLTGLGVSQILLVDSSSISLWDGAKEDFPGTRTTAGIKWHACFDLLTGVLAWFQLTPTSTHDRKCFPEVETLKGKLIIFDLGYWDLGLLLAIEQAKGFFLCRLKTNTVIYIKEVLSGMSKNHVGQSINSIKFKIKRGNIIEVVGKKKYKNDILVYRVIGFWNPSERIYRWYITNLTAPAAVIYPLYRLRWQIELIFKSCKQSLNTNRLTSNHSNIIESLMLASIAAHLISTPLLHIGINQLDEDQQLAISFQRISKVAVVLARDFVMFFIHSSKRYLQGLIQKIILFADEIFDPNYKHRETSLMLLNRMLQGGS